MTNAYIPKSGRIGPLTIYDMVRVEGRTIVITQQPHQPAIDFSRMRVNGHKPVEIYSHTRIEPATTLYYDLDTPSVEISYLDWKSEVEINEFKPTEFLLVSGTLCKDDVLQAPDWIDYHRKHGVQHFLIYYNDSLNAGLLAKFEGAPVTFVEWSLPWSIPNHDGASQRGSEFVSVHGCQPPALAHMFHVTGRRAEWLFNHDLDEFAVSDRPLIHLLKGDVMMLSRQNVWIEGLNPLDRRTWHLSQAKADGAESAPKYAGKPLRVRTPRVHDCVDRGLWVENSKKAHLMHLVQCSGSPKEKINFTRPVKTAAMHPLAATLGDQAARQRASGSHFPNGKQAVHSSANSWSLAMSLFRNHGWRAAFFLMAKPWRALANCLARARKS